jgi:transposase
MEHATQKEALAVTKSLIEPITKRIKKVEQVMEKLIKENSDWQKQKEILESVPGIGADTVRTILAELPELGTGGADSVCALVGVVPVNRDSGKMRGKRSLFGGRGSVRVALHNAAMAAVFLTKKDNVFKKMYQKMTSEGKKAPNVARIAVAHKMLKIIHALLKYGVKWENKIKPA